MKEYINCPHCGKKLFRIDKKSVYKHIYMWCKNCKKEILIEPKSLDK
jgi:DNA-directed RNA polymerase subunit RPC12/RpoP|nr:MAG TPA: zinc-ribbon domain protein [Caudoviricetes sp.]